SKIAKDFSRYQLEDQKLNGEVKRLKVLWESIVVRLNEINLLKDNGGYTLKTVAAPREELAFKRQLKIVGGGTGFGLLLAFGLAWLRTLRDTTLKTADEVRHLLGLSVIGGVPAMEFKATRALTDST